MRITVVGKLPSFHEYMNGIDGKKDEQEKLKQQIEDKLLWGIKQSNVRGTDEPVILKINWYEKDRTRDANNVVFAKKFIIEALVKSNVLNGKTRRYIKGFQDELFVDSTDPRIEIELIEQNKY